MKLRKEYYQNFKTRKRIYPIQWSSGKGEKVMSYATSHHYGEINIISGKLTKDSYPSDITNKISALNFISSESGDVIVCFLISCEIVLYNKTYDKCFIIKGPSDLKNCKFYVSTKKPFNPIQKFNTFIKKYNNREGSEPAKEASSESPKETVHVAEETCYKPKIFTSSNLSKIFLIFNNKKVFFYSEQQNAFKTSDDPWELFEMPQEATPSQKDREISIDVSFINTLGGSFSCISFCFFRDEQLNIASLLLQENFNKYGTKTNSEWMRKIVNLGYNIKRKNSLLLKISPNDLTFCVVVNTYENSFQLLFGHINRESVAVVDCPYPVKDLELNNRFQWVNCIDWIAKSNFIIGCLRSGYIFISSRFGRLLKIEWSSSSLSDSIAGYFINIFPEFNISKRNITKENDESESDATAKTSSSSKPKFSFLVSPSSTRIAICSGFGICLFTLPENILSNEGALSVLLENTHRSNHSLENSLKNHEYDFIHFSNWRLATSEHHNQILQDQDQNLTVCSLWYPRNIKYEKCKITPSQTELESQKEDVCLWLKGAWSFLVSKNFTKSKRKFLIEATISETIKLFQSLLMTSSNDGEEHQASLLQCLRIFHQILQYCLSVSPCAYKAVNAFLQLLYRLLNLVMKSAKAVSMERKLICILILTQTLITVKSSFISTDLIPHSHYHDLKFENIINILMIKHWMYLYKSFLRVWKENKVQNSQKMKATQTMILNIIQDSVWDSLLLFSNVKLYKEYRIFFSGKSLLVVRDLKKKVDDLFEGFSRHRKIKRLIFFSFHIIILEEEWDEMTCFLSWFVSKLLTISTSKGEKNCTNHFIKSMKKIFNNLLGFLGIIMAKFILNVPISIQNSFKYYDYSSIFDNPQEKSRKLKFRKDCTNSYFTVANAVRCLIIGKKYESVFHLAFQHKDINLCLYTLSLGIENHINGKEIPSMTNYLLTVLIELLPANSDKLPFTDSLFLIEELLYLGVLEGLEDLLILSLRKCLSEVESLMEALPLIVPFDFSLPSPPLFCPQMDTTYPVGYDEESKSEIFIREKLSQWITSFCFLCVAANVDELLTKYTIETELKPQMKRKHLNQFYSPLSNGKENLLLENDSQWTELKLIWRRLFKCFYALHARDNLSLSVRTCEEAKRDMCKIKKVQELSSVILEKSDRISSLKNCWESDSFFIVLTSALEAPCTAETAHFVARNVARQTQIPSLAKGKLDKMLNYWKGFDVFPNEGQYGDGYDKINLFDLYEHYLKLEKETCGSNENTSNPLTFSEEDVKIIYLFFTMTFKSYRTQYLKFERLYPLLKQFSNNILKSEFEEVDDKFLSNFLMIQKHTISKSERNFKFDYLSSEEILFQKKGLFRNSNSKFLSESFSKDIAKVIFSSDRTIPRKLKRSKSFTLLKNKSQNNIVLQRSKSFSDSKKQSRKILLSLKFPDENVSLSDDFTKFISQIFRFCAFDFSCELKSVSQEYRNFCVWFLWTTRNYNTFLNSGKSAAVNYFRKIFSAEEMTQAFIWHCNSKRNNQNRTETTGDINNEHSQEHKFLMDPENRTEEEISSRNPSLGDDECVDCDMRNFSKDSLGRKDFYLNESTEPECIRVNSVSIVGNSTENMKSISDSREKHDAESKNGGFWQPFLVVDSLSEPNYPSNVNFPISCNNNEFIKTNVDDSKDVMSNSKSCNFVTRTNNSNYSTSQTNNTSRVSSLPCDISLSDNTLKDITLTDSFPEQNINKNPEHFGTFTDCPLKEKYQSRQPFMGVNNLTFLKNPLTNNLEQSKKSSVQLTAKPLMVREKFHPFSALDVSNLMLNPEQTEILSSQESNWVLKKVPSEFIKNTDSCQKKCRQIFPSKLLKASSDNNKKSVSVAFKGLPITHIHTPSSNKTTPLCLLKIPLKSEVHHINFANSEFKALKLNDSLFSTKKFMKQENRKSSFTQTSTETQTFLSRSTQTGQTGSKVTFVQQIQESEQLKIVESIVSQDSDSKPENKFKERNSEPKEFIQSTMDAKLKSREISVQTKNQSLEKSTQMKGLIVELKESSSQTESKIGTKALKMNESTQTRKISNRSVSIETSNLCMINKATSVESNIFEQESSLICQKDESEVDERPLFPLQEENFNNNVKEVSSPELHYSSSFEDDNYHVKKENSLYNDNDDGKGSDEYNSFSKGFSADSIRNSLEVKSLCEQDDSTLGSDSKYSEKVIEGNSFDENLSRSITGSHMSSASLEPKPKSINDILSMFMTGTIQIEEVFELISATDELAKFIEKHSEDNLNEHISKLLKIFANHVYAAKIDIEETRTLLDKVDSIVKNAFTQEKEHSINELKQMKNNVAKKPSITKQNDEQIVKFLQNISHNNLTQNILMQMNYVENDEKTDSQRYSNLEDHLSRCSSTLTPNTQSEMQFSGPSDKSSLQSKQQGGRSYLNLHLHRFGLSGESPVSTAPPSEYSDLNKDIRKKQIREFMKRKRLEKIEESKRNSLIPKGGLSSREILHINQEKKGNRMELKRKHSEKRKEECLSLLSDHFREKSSVEHIMNLRGKSITHLGSSIKSKNYPKEIPDHRILINKKKVCNVSPSHFNRRYLNPKNQIERFSDYLKSIKPIENILHSRRFTSSKSHLGMRPSKSNPNLSSAVRSLDRISEIDSSSSHSATLTDSSWSLPDDVKRILYNGNEK